MEGRQFLGAESLIRAAHVKNEVLDGECFCRDLQSLWAYVTYELLGNEKFQKQEIEECFTSSL